MEVEQIYKITNEAVKQATGKEDLLLEDLSNVVDVGKEVIGSDNVDGYVKSLINHIGKVVFVNRPYEGRVPSVLKDGWEYGSILEKVSFGLPEATVNESWQLEDGKSYDPHVFNKPEVTAKFFNKRVTFEIDMSITEMQVKQSFSSAEQLNGFISGIETAIRTSLTIRLGELIKKTINSMMAHTIFDAFGKETDGKATAPAGQSGTRAVNLLHLYQQEVDETLTDPAKALRDPEFIRFAAFKLDLYRNYLVDASTLFNIGGEVRFTPESALHVVTLQEFKSAASVYLESDTYNKELVALPKAETVNFWQGTGKDFASTSASKINVAIEGGKEVEADGIITVMFDDNALGVANENSRVTTEYNAKAEFTNYFYKEDAQYFNDTNENFIVFYVK